MQRLPKIMCLLALLVLVPGMAQGVKYEFAERSSSQWGEDYDPSVSASDVMINLRDCEENRTFTFSITEMPSDVGNKDLVVYFGSDCKTSDTCESYPPFAAEEGKYTYTARELLFITSADECVGEGSGSVTTWAALVADGEKSTATWADAPVTISWDMILPSAPSNLTATAAEEKVELDWEMEGVEEEDEGDGGTSSTGSSSDGNRYIVVYWDISGSGGGGNADGGLSDDTDTEIDTDVDTDIDIDMDGGLDAGADGDTDTDIDTDTDTDTDTDIDTDADAGTHADAGTSGSSWRLNGAADDVVECSTGGFEKGDEYDPDGSYKQKIVPSTEGTKSQISGLTNGSTYKFAVVARDDHFNYSVVSETVCSIPNETVDFFEEYLSAGGKGGKFCFVATAAFGSYDHPVVKVLRRFRDDFLEPLPGGNTLIEAYYSIGPVAAAVVNGSSVLRGLTQGGLTVFAVASIPLTAMGPAGTALALTALVFGFVFLRRRKRN